MAGFTPDADALSQLVNVLRHADSPSTEAQRVVVQQLDHFSITVPSLPAYLVYIFANASDESENVRLRAGLALKNAVVQRLAAWPAEILEYVKETIWLGLEDPSVQVRNTAASVLDWLFKTLGPSNWPQVLVKLLQYMNSDKQATQEVPSPIFLSCNRIADR